MLDVATRNQRHRDRRIIGGAMHELGYAFLDYTEAEGDLPGQGVTRGAYVSNAQHLNPVGLVQGGFLMAMLDEILTDAVLIATDHKSYVPTLAMQAQFIKPARPGKFIAEARVRHLGRATAFLAGTLYDHAGDIVTTATATVTFAKPPK